MSKGLLNKTSSSAVASRRVITKDKDLSKELITIQEARNKIEKLVRLNSSRITDRHNKIEKPVRHKTEIKTTITDLHGRRATDHRSQTEAHKARRKKENKNKIFESSGLHRNFFYATSFVLLKGTIISI